MVNSPLNERKILFTIVLSNAEEMQKQLQVINSTQFLIANGFSVQVNFAVRNKSLASIFNDAQRNSDAKYKIYLTSWIRQFHPAILINMINTFSIYPNIGMIGFVGSELPIDGDYTKAQNRYGSYSHMSSETEFRTYTFKDCLYTQSVHVLDSGLFVTADDLPWDENVGDYFAVAAQCCNFRSKGYSVEVVYQEMPWFVFAKNELNYNINLKSEGEQYSQQLENFRSLYKRQFQPLVSVLIPTYNQPKFLKAALDSALNQTYENIEIVIGDDSTNTLTKELVEPYLREHTNIRYYYHGGPLGGKGIQNMLFLANHCSGEYVNYLFHDDLFYPEKISRMMAYYVRDLENRISLVTSARDEIDSDGKLIRRMNPWQPHKDTVINGKTFGRIILIKNENFIGEMTTILIKRKYLLVKDAIIDKELFTIGCFGGICDTAFGDIPTFLNIFRQDKDCVFIAERLSAFRNHSANNGKDPFFGIKLHLDFAVFLVTAWLNNLFFRNIEEYRYSCLRRLMPVNVTVSADDSEEMRHFKEWLIKIVNVVRAGDVNRMLDVTINYLLEHLNNKSALLPLIRKNPTTGLWEKANDGIMVRCTQR